MRRRTLSAALFWSRSGAKGENLDCHTAAAPAGAAAVRNDAGLASAERGGVSRRGLGLWTCGRETAPGASRVGIGGSINKGN